MRRFSVLISVVILALCVDWCSESSVSPDAPGFSGSWQAGNYAASYKIIDNVVFSNPLNGIWMERISRITVKGSDVTIVIHNPWNGPNQSDYMTYTGELKGNQIIGRYKMNYMSEIVSMNWERMK